MKMSMKLQGFEKLAQQLKGMPDKLMRQTIAPAVKASAKVMADDMRRKAPTGDNGYIRKSIAVYSDQGKAFRKWARFNPKTYVSYITGPIKPVVPVDREGRVVTSYGTSKMASRMLRSGGAKKWRPFYAIFFEKGAKGHEIKAKRRSILASQNVKGSRQKNKSGSPWTFFGFKVNVGAFPRKPFVRPAFDENVKPTINRMRTELEKGVQKAMA